MKSLKPDIFYGFLLLISPFLITGFYQISHVNYVFSIGIQDGNTFNEIIPISYSSNIINDSGIALNELLVRDDLNYTVKNNTDKTLKDFASIIHKKSFSNLDDKSIMIGYGISEFVEPVSVFAESLNKLLVIFGDNDSDNEYLFVINGSNILEYNKTQISGNDVLDIDGFRFDETDNKIYAYGDYHYLEGSIYDIKYGLGTSFQNHSIFAIDPTTSKIEASITLSTQESEGDETRISDLFINSNTNDLIVVSTDEGDLDDIHIVKKNPLRVESVFSAYDLLGEGGLYNVMYDGNKNILYTCNEDNSLIGVELSNKNMLKKNLSDILCPTYLNPLGNKGFFIDHLKDEFGFVDLDNGKSTTILSGGNFSSINWGKQDNKTAFLIGHSISMDEHSCYSSANTSHYSNSYIIEIDVFAEKIKSIYEFDNMYIDDIIENPNQDTIYALATEKISHSNRCYLNLKLLNLDISPNT